MWSEEAEAILPGMMPPAARGMMHSASDAVISMQLARHNERLEGQTNKELTLPGMGHSASEVIMPAAQTSNAALSATSVWSSIIEEQHDYMQQQELLVQRKRLYQDHFARLAAACDGLQRHLQSTSNGLQTETEERQNEVETLRSGLSRTDSLLCRISDQLGAETSALRDALAKERQQREDKDAENRAALNALRDQYEREEAERSRAEIKLRQELRTLQSWADTFEKNMHGWDGTKLDGTVSGNHGERLRQLEKSSRDCRQALFGEEPGESTEEDVKVGSVSVEVSLGSVCSMASIRSRLNEPAALNPRDRSLSRVEALLQAANESVADVKQLAMDSAKAAQLDAMTRLSQLEAEVAATVMNLTNGLNLERKGREAQVLAAQQACEQLLERERGERNSALMSHAQNTQGKLREHEERGLQRLNSLGVRTGALEESTGRLWNEHNAREDWSDREVGDLQRRTTTLEKGLAGAREDLMRERNHLVERVTVLETDHGRRLRIQEERGMADDQRREEKEVEWFGWQRDLWNILDKDWTSKAFLQQELCGAHTRNLEELNKSEAKLGARVDEQELVLNDFGEQMRREQDRGRRAEDRLNRVENVKLKDTNERLEEGKVSIDALWEREEKGMKEFRELEDRVRTLGLEKSNFHDVLEECRVQLDEFGVRMATNTALDGLEQSFRELEGRMDRFFCGQERTFLQSEEGNFRLEIWDDGNLAILRRYARGVGLGEEEEDEDGRRGLGRRRFAADAPWKPAMPPVWNVAPAGFARHSVSAQKPLVVVNREWSEVGKWTAARGLRTDKRNRDP